MLLNLTISQFDRDRFNQSGRLTIHEKANFNNKRVLIPNNDGELETILDRWTTEYTYEDKTGESPKHFVDPDDQWQVTGFNNLYSILAGE
jgi:hypothetical protein